MTLNVLFAGVGGQGIVTASDLLAQAALECGWSVRKAESHGMAQRGGSVVSHVRMSDDLDMVSPLIPEGSADWLIGLEVLETARALPMLRPGGRVIADARRVPTAAISSGQTHYPEGLEGELAGRGTVLDATGEAMKLGDGRAANSMLLGVLSVALPFPVEAWRAAFAGRLRGDALTRSLGLFALGREWPTEELAER